jgi:hypothetical protein
MSSAYGTTTTQGDMQTVILPNGQEFITEMLYTPAQTHGVIVSRIRLPYPLDF